MKMKRMNLRTMGLMTMAALLAAACQNDEQPVDAGTHVVPVKIRTGVSVDAEAGTRALVTGTSFGDGESIGVTLKNSAGQAYDGIDYRNVQYTSSGTVPAQTWDAASTDILLSSTVGKAAAYYPYNSGTAYADITAIPVETASVTDYMYSGWCGGLSNAAPTADITMYHAMAVVRVILKKGTYTGAGSVTALSATSPQWATAGSMDATTGEVTPTAAAKGLALTWAGTMTLNATGEAIDLTAVCASDDNKAVTFTLTMDGNTYTATGTFGASGPEKGNIYTFTLTANATELIVGSVTINPWNTPVDKGAPELLPVHS